VKRGTRAFLIAAAVVLLIGIAGVVAKSLVHANETPKSLSLSKDEVVGAWRDPSGGVLRINADGTFTAHSVCGFGITRESGSQHGTWSQVSSGDWADGPGVMFIGTTLQVGLGLTGSHAAPELWRYQGDPDENHRCVVHKVRDH
jgi:hypothetical protein